MALGLAAVILGALAEAGPPDPRERLVAAVWRGEQGPWVVVTVTGGNHANGKLMAIGGLVARHLLAPR